MGSETAVCVGTPDRGDYHRDPSARSLCHGRSALMRTNGVIDLAKLGLNAAEGVQCVGLGPAIAYPSRQIECRLGQLQGLHAMPDVTMSCGKAVERTGLIVA